VQELGPERFRAELEARTSFELTPAGEHLSKRHRGDHIGVHRQRQDGLYYVGLNIPVGRISGEDFIELARVVEEHGGSGLRLATDQNVVLIDIPEARLPGLLEEPLLQTFSPHPKPFERGVVACTGSEFCRFGIVETKANALNWARHLDRHVSTNGSPIVRMHFSGCSASCAQPQIADIGFRGETAKTEDAIVEGADIGLGGSLGHDSAFIDWVAGAVPAEEIPDALVRLVNRFEREHRDDERFHEWARRTPNDELRQTVAGTSDE
jgi:ferredoxin-nitrite reductase